MCDNAEEYYPKRIKSLTEERYLLCRQLNMSYIETGELTPNERESLIKLFIDEKNREREALQNRSN